MTLGREAAQLIARTRQIAERRKELIAMQARDLAGRTGRVRSKPKTRV